MTRGIGDAPAPPAPCARACSITPRFAAMFSFYSRRDIKHENLGTGVAGRGIARIDEIINSRQRIYATIRNVSCLRAGSRLIAEIIMA